MERETNIKLPGLKQDDVDFLEKEIDRMDGVLEPMRNFILPGGHPVVAQVHIARCVCRRAERCIMRLNSEEKVEEILIQYINRLSDYLFTLARYESLQVGASEHAWVPEK
jgi:cob(I)alamin adenosyltransferase